MAQSEKIILTISGPSCAGKNTVAKHLQDRSSLGFEKVILTTTRPPKPGEMDGKDYNFVSKKAFKELVWSERLIEHSSSEGHLQGISKLSVERVFSRGKKPIIVVDPKGAAAISSYCLSVGATIVPIFIDSPVYLVLERFHNKIRDESKNNPDFDLGHYARRVFDAMETERVWKHMLDYDVIFPASDEKDSVSLISKGIESMCSAPNFVIKGAPLQLRLTDSLPNPYTRDKGIIAIKQSIKDNLSAPRGKFAILLGRNYAKNQNSLSQSPSEKSGRRAQRRIRKAFDL